MEVFTGQYDQQGQPIMRYVYEEVLDPATNKPMEDENGNILMAPIPEADTEIAFTKIDVSVETTAFNDEDEKNQLMLETILSGSIGSMLSQVNPAGFFKAAGLSLKTMRTKHSPDIANILEETAMMLGNNPQAQQQASLMAQGNGIPNQRPKSESLKLPQNTNEEI